MENKELYLYLQEALNKYPNDQELGKFIRSYVLKAAGNSSFMKESRNSGNTQKLGESLLEAIRKANSNEKH